MKVLAKISEIPDTYVLVRFKNGTIPRKLRSLIGKGEYRRAVLEALSKGDFLRKVSEIEKGGVKADLIITPKSAHWDVTG